MKCPNCRCYVPESMAYCDYCGFEFSDGRAKTLPVEEAYRERIIQPDCGAPAYDLPYGDYRYYYEGGYYGYFEAQDADDRRELMDTLLLLFAGAGLIVLLLILAILIMML